MHSFEGLHAPQPVLDAVARGEISSFCLFAGLNLETPAQVRALSESLYHAARTGGNLPPIIGADQEGGQLMAVHQGVTELPGNMALGATRSPALARAAGEVLARELLAMGINMNFAPSLDVVINSKNPVIGTRSFSDDPELVAALGTAMIEGMQSLGVIATAKHFPGHGDTENDTHFSATSLDVSRERLESVELLPFRAAIRTGVGAVMSAHITVPVLDADYPATVSRAVLHHLLRGQLGFDGLICTDAMDMHAVARIGREASIRAALDAGVDLVLLAHLTDQLGLAKTLAPFARSEALRRIQSVRAKLPTELPSLDIVGSREHRAVAQQIAEQSITKVKDIGRLPLQVESESRIAVIVAEPTNLTPADTSDQITVTLASEIRQRHPNTDGYCLAHDATASETAAILQAVATADTVIVGTINASADSAQTHLVRELVLRGQQPIVVALRMPDDLLAFPMVDTYLCAYSIRSITMAAVARVLFGEIEASGRLPCKLPLNVA